MGLNSFQRRRQRAMRRLLYSLKRRYGLPAEFYHLSSPDDFDPTTGINAPTRTSTKIRRLIYFEPTERQKFQYALSYVAANKNFTYGGHFNEADLWLILDANDIDGTVDMNDYFIIEGRRVNVAQIKHLHAEAGFVISARETSGELRHQIHEKTLYHTIPLDQEITHE